jgi:hypothetical protein
MQMSFIKLRASENFDILLRIFVVLRGKDKLKSNSRKKIEKRWIIPLHQGYWSCLQGSHPG